MVLTAPRRATSAPPIRAERDRYDAAVQPPAGSDTWIGLTDGELPVAAAYEWCVRPDCGAVVLFSGTVRSSAVDEAGARREGVEHLTYEAYETQVLPRFEAIAQEARRRWPQLGRVAILHRVGRIELGESSVVTAVSSPHRPEAFEAARYAIDALKASAPIWKHEVWREGDELVEGWGTGAHVVVDPADVRSGS
jgi:molybdopterin synthase catalytic subunit